MENYRKLLVIILLTIFAGFVALPNPNINLVLGPLQINRNLDFKEGLDLAGGSHIVLSADMSKIAPENKNQALESLRTIIEKRVNFFGVSEPVIQTAKVNGDYRIIVELAGITDTNAAINLIGKTAQLVFREEASPSAFTKETNLTGLDLSNAAASFNQNTGEPIVNLTFTDDGAKKFEEITKRNLNKRVAIFLDDQILMAPTVQSVISGGKAIISGQFTTAQTKEMSALLNSGALPAPVKIIEERTVGATLGQDSIQKSLVAGLIGLAAVAIFMILKYRTLGVIADLALIVYVILSLASFKLIPITLTLAGIAGFILSIGMAVDANILIFERMREEIRWGKPKVQAIELGFTRAFPSIKDSNLNSLIICGILYWFGTGAVRGFAITLAVGILISLFSAIVVTRTLLRIFKNA